MDKRTGVVYCIENEYNGFWYVGSTIHEKHRIARHLRHLRKGKHFNKDMQRDFNEHGEQYFKVRILRKDIPEEDLHLWEVAEIGATMINAYGCYNKSKSKRISPDQRQMLRRKRLIERQMQWYRLHY